MVTKSQALTFASVGALVSVLIVFAKSFGVPVTADQEAAIKDVVLVGGPIVGGLVLWFRARY